MREVYQKYRAKMMVNGQEYNVLQVKVPTSKGERLIYWGAIPLKVVKPSSQTMIVDAPFREQWKDWRSDLIQRLQAKPVRCAGHRSNAKSTMYANWRT